MMRCAIARKRAHHNSLVTIVRTKQEFLAVGDMAVARDGVAAGNDALCHHGAVAYLSRVLSTLSAVAYGNGPFQAPRRLAAPRHLSKIAVNR